MVRLKLNFSLTIVFISGKVTDVAKKHVTVCENYLKKQIDNYFNK